MYLRKLMITTMLSILMLGTTGVSANQSSTITVNNMPMKNKYYCQRMGGILTVEQQGELRNIMDNLHEQLTPLIKKKIGP